MEAYHIKGWKRRYEVTDKAAEAKADTELGKLKKGPLRFVRSKVRGHVLGPAYRSLMKKAFRLGPGIDLAAFGLFQKLLELAADQEREFRGWILDHNQQPINAKQITELLMIGDIDVVERCLELLCDEEIGWVEKLEFCGKPVKSQEGLGSPSQGSGKSRDIGPRGSGKSPLNETETGLDLTEGEEVSDAAPVISDSEITETKEEAIKQVCRLLWVSPENQSDITTFRDIFEQIADVVNAGRVTIKIYERMVDEAKEAALHQSGRKGRFINAMKRSPFCYVPVRREVPGGRL